MKDIKKKYLSTSILTTLILASTTLGYVNVANAKTYTNEGSVINNNVSTVDASTLVGNTKLTNNISNQVDPKPYGLYIEEDSNIIFTGEMRWPNLSRLKIRNYEIQFAS